MFRNPDRRRSAVVFIIAIAAMTVLFTIAITATLATSLPAQAQPTGLSPTVAQDAPRVLRSDWPAIASASTTYENPEELA
jgi:hypothetical protein